MAKFGHTLISGILWIVITAGIGWFGMSLTDNGGFVSLLGWLIALGAFTFAGLSLMHIIRITSLQLRALKLMREDPEGFAELAQMYRQASERIEQNGVEFELVSGEEFFARTMNGRPNQMETKIYDGHSFECACGDSHTFDTGEIDVLSELAGMCLVLACPNGKGVTCVKITGGPFKFKGFKSNFGAASEGVG